MDVKSLRTVGIVIAFFALVLLVCGGCSSVSYNRYQDAETLGKGTMRLQASVQWEPSHLPAIYDDIDERFDDRLGAWLRNSGYDDDPNIWDNPGGGLADALGNIFGEPDRDRPNPGAINLECLFAYGVTDIVDLEARATLGGYARANAKIRLASLGESGALSIAPGIGYRAIRYSDYWDSDLYRGFDQIEISDRVNGNLYTAEVPLIFGYKTGPASLYAAPFYAFHYTTLSARRETSGFEEEFRTELDRTYNIHVVGLIAGVKFQWGRFVFTPEVGAVYSPTFNSWNIAPGIALGASWE